MTAQGHPRQRLPSHCPPHTHWHPTTQPVHRHGPKTRGTIDATPVDETPLEEMPHHRAPLLETVAIRENHRRFTRVRPRHRAETGQRLLALRRGMVQRPTRDVDHVLGVRHVAAMHGCVIAAPRSRRFGHRIRACGRCRRKRSLANRTVHCAVIQRLRQLERRPRSGLCARLAERKETSPSYRLRGPRWCFNRQQRRKSPWAL